MSLRQRVDELEKEVRTLRGELVAARDALFNRTKITYPRIVGPNVVMGVSGIDIKVVMKMLMNHLGLKIKKTPEKISLEIVNVQPLENNPEN